jgi:hypothetical protein
MLSAALASPLAMRADDKHHDRDEHHRYWDASERDWHEWNDREDRAYRRYLENQHHAYREWTKANKREQEAYWRWRHHHSDEMLWPNGR